MKNIVSRGIIIAVTQIAAFAGVFITGSDALSNRALTSSPRALEEFPALARVTSGPVVAPGEKPAPLSLAAPRLKEEYPRLARIVQPAKDRAIGQRAAARGIAANPRAIEENPALARTPAEEPQFQVAPLK